MVIESNRVKLGEHCRDSSKNIWAWVKLTKTGFKSMDFDNILEKTCKKIAKNFKNLENVQ